MDIHFPGCDFPDSDFDVGIPRTLRFGFAFIYDRIPNDGKWYKPFSIKSAAELYSASVVSMKSIGIGLELSVLSFLNGRIGYYRESTPDEFIEFGGQKVKKKFTYGLGIFVPVSRYVRSVPVSISIDYAQYKEPHDKELAVLFPKKFNLLQFTLNYEVK